MSSYSIPGTSQAFDVLDGTIEKNGDNMLKRIGLLSQGLLFLLFGAFAQTSIAGDGYLGMSMPGWWRPFAANSPWNTPVPGTATTHPESGSIIGGMAYATRDNLKAVRFADDFQSTMHIVGKLDPTTQQIPKYYYHSYDQNHNTNIYRFTHNENFWNPDADEPFDITDAEYPFIPGKTVPENTEDGRMTIIDVTSYPSYYAFEVSHGKKDLDAHGHAQCSTFNIWDLAGTGTVKNRPICTGNTQWPDCDDYWTCAGGRGAGVPIIAGIVRPEELDLAVSPGGDGKIHHALSFAYDYNRCGPPLYPFAYRNDGTYQGNEYPIEGMLFQLRSDFPVNSIQNPYGRVIARTLKTYGAVLVDGGGGNSMAFNLQNLFTDAKTNRDVWEERFPGFYNSITVIDPSQFRVVNTPATLSANPLCDHAEICLCP